MVVAVTGERGGEGMGMGGCCGAAEGEEGGRGDAAEATGEKEGEATGERGGGSGVAAAETDCCCCCCHCFRRTSKGGRGGRGSMVRKGAEWGGEGEGASIYSVEMKFPRSRGREPPSLL